MSGTALQPERKAGHKKGGHYERSTPEERAQRAAEIEKIRKKEGKQDKPSTKTKISLLLDMESDEGVVPGPNPLKGWYFRSVKTTKEFYRLKFKDGGDADAASSAAAKEKVDSTPVISEFLALALKHDKEGTEKWIQTWRDEQGGDDEMLEFAKGIASGKYRSYREEQTLRQYEKNAEDNAVRDAMDGTAWDSITLPEGWSRDMQRTTYIQYKDPSGDSRTSVVEWLALMRAQHPEAVDKIFEDHLGGKDGFIPKKVLATDVSSLSVRKCRNFDWVEGNKHLPEGWCMNSEGVSYHRYFEPKLCPNSTYRHFPRWFAAFLHFEPVAAQAFIDKFVVPDCQMLLEARAFDIEELRTKGPCRKDKEYESGRARVDPDVWRKAPKKWSKLEEADPAEKKKPSRKSGSKRKPGTARKPKSTSPGGPASPSRGSDDGEDDSDDDVSNSSSSGDGSSSDGDDSGSDAERMSRRPAPQSGSARDGPPMVVGALAGSAGGAGGSGDIDPPYVWPPVSVY